MTIIIKHPKDWLKTLCTCIRRISAKAFKPVYIEGRRSPESLKPPYMTLFGPKVHLGPVDVGVGRKDPSGDKMVKYQNQNVPSRRNLASWDWFDADNTFCWRLEYNLKPREPNCKIAAKFI